MSARTADEASPLRIGTVVQRAHAIQRHVWKPPACTRRAIRAALSDPPVQAMVTKSQVPIFMAIDHRDSAQRSLRIVDHA